MKNICANATCYWWGKRRSESILWGYLSTVGWSDIHEIFFSYEVQYISLASTFYFHRLVHFMILWGTAIFFVPVIFHYFYQFCMCISAWILWTLGNVLLKILHGCYFILYVLVSQYNVWLSLLLLSLLLLLLLLRMTFWMM